MLEQKKQFKYLLAILALILLLMPLLTTMNDVLTRVVMRLDYYRYIQDYIIPWEIRMVAVIIAPLGLNPVISGEYLKLGGINGLLLEIAWNCVGWQSLLFFIITAFIGLQGDQYSWVSKIKALLIGVLGTLIINLLRITGVALIAYYLGQNVAMVLHDYGSTLLIIIWLFFFWWFSYSFVLESK